MIEHKTYATAVTLEDMQVELRQLVRQNLANGTLPYLSDEPLPQDMNVITGKHLGDINKALLELKAANIGAKTLQWIWGAHAEILGLELKDTNPKEHLEAKKNNKNFDCEPVICCANVQRNKTKSILDACGETDIAAEGVKTEAQCVYLLDQFTPESITRAMRPNNIENAINRFGNIEAQKQIKIISQNLQSHFSEYNTGIAEQDRREKMKNNALANYDQNRIVDDIILVEDERSKQKRKEIASINVYKQKVVPAYQAMIKNCSKSQVYVTHALSNYFLQQSTGLTASKKANKQDLIQAFKDLSEQEPSVLFKTIANTIMYTDQSCHYNFSLDRIYSEKEEIERRKNIANRPAAADLIKQNAAQNIISDKEISRLRNHSKQYIPHRAVEQQQERGR